jgi:N-acylneuraminate cytidylyltransferase
LAKDIAHDEGASFLYRDSYMCGHEARLYEYNNYMLNTIPGDPIVAWTMTTAPLFDDYLSVVSKYLSLDVKSHDSLITVIPHNGFLVDVNAKPINCSFGHWHLLTQELRESYEITGGVYMAQKSDQLKWSYWFGPKAYLYQTSKIKSIDVDDEEDFKIAEILHSSVNK